MTSGQPSSPRITPAALAQRPIQSAWIQVDTADGTMDAYLVTPPAGRGPGLLLLQEIFGVNAHIRGVAEQYALAGFTVLAPDLFFRHARLIELGYEGEERERARALMQTVSRDQVVGDMHASVSTLRGLPSCGPRVGVIGYCMGGRLAFAAAALCKVDAAVAYYGGGIAGQLELSPRIRVPMQFHHAEHDASIPPEAVASVQAAMADRADVEFHHYPGAQHGFNCWSRSAYHPASAALALGRSLGFLARLF